MQVFKNSRRPIPGAQPTELFLEHCQRRKPRLACRRNAMCGRPGDTRGVTLRRIDFTPIRMTRRAHCKGVCTKSTRATHQAHATCDRMEMQDFIWLSRTPLKSHVPCAARQARGFEAIDSPRELVAASNRALNAPNRRTGVGASYADLDRRRASRRRNGFGLSTEMSGPHLMSGYATR